MTADEYRGRIRGFGLTPARPAYDGATLHQDRNCQYVVVPDPETLSEVERKDVLDMLMAREGYSDPN